MARSGPNLQNIPIRTETGRQLREALRPLFPRLKVDLPTELEWRILTGGEPDCAWCARLGKRDPRCEADYCPADGPFGD